jgi:hypothetical protein
MFYKALKSANMIFHYIYFNINHEIIISIFYQENIFLILIHSISF